MFVECTDFRTHVALSAIRLARIARDADNDKVLSLFDAEGRHLGDTQVEWFERAVTSAAPIIPAQPSTYVVSYYWIKDTDGIVDGVHVEPVLAWRASPYGGLEPLTLQLDVSGQYGVMLPDGKVIVPEDTEFSSLAVYEEAMRTRGAAEREAREKIKEKRSE